MGNLNKFLYGMYDGAMIWVASWSIFEMSQGNFFQSESPWYSRYAGFLAAGLVGGTLRLIREGRKDITNLLKDD